MRDGPSGRRRASKWCVVSAQPNGDLLMLSKIFNIGYTGLLGPVCYAIIGETSSTRLRNKSISLGRIVYAIWNLAMNIANSYMINPSALNWQGKTAFFWMPFCTTAIAWSYFRLPEYKGRSFYEIDVLFERKVPARKFKSTILEPDADEHLMEGVQLR
jgi:SP family general alpha glucoside:H+ symporter-like MFS transporter